MDLYFGIKLPFHGKTIRIITEIRNFNSQVLWGFFYFELNFSISVCSLSLNEFSFDGVQYYISPLNRYTFLIRNNQFKNCCF